MNKTLTLTLFSFSGRHHKTKFYRLALFQQNCLLFHTTVVNEFLNVVKKKLIKLKAISLQLTARACASLMECIGGAL